MATPTISWVAPGGSGLPTGTASPRATTPFTNFLFAASTRAAVNGGSRAATDGAFARAVFAAADPPVDPLFRGLDVRFLITVYSPPRNVRMVARRVRPVHPQGQSGPIVANRCTAQPPTSIGATRDLLRPALVVRC